MARFLQIYLRDGSWRVPGVLAWKCDAPMRRICVNGRRRDLGLGWFRPASQRDADQPFVERLDGGAGFLDLIRIYPT